MPEQADVVIVGSGIAGAMCAWRLAQRGLKVLVLEAGPRVDRGDIIAAFKATPRTDHTAGYPYSRFAPSPQWIAGKADDYIRQSGPDVSPFEYLRLVGGTTWHWTGAADRLLPVDFRMRSTYGVGVDWPTSYEEIEPYYVEAEREMGVSGMANATGGSPRSQPHPMPAMAQSYYDKILATRLQGMGIEVIPRPAARNSLSYDNRPSCEGHGTCVPICPIGAQYAAIVHIEKAEKLGVRVLADSRADRIEIVAGAGSGSVRFGRPDGSSDIARGRIIVVAANAVESSRLLLASAGESNSSGVANSSGNVGRNFMSHPGFLTRLETPYPLYANRGPMFTSYSGKFRDDPSRRERSAFILVFYNQGPFFDLAAELVREGLTPPALDSELRRRAVRMGVLETFVEQLPDQDNRISIDWHDRDKSGQPRILLKYALGEYERRGIAFARRTFNEIAQQLEARPFKEGELFSAHHLMGTLRMGSDPKASVVDSFGRTHDHTNLFVVGSAIFPTGGTASPSLTIAALSLRTADAIVRQLS